MNKIQRTALLVLLLLIPSMSNGQQPAVLITDDGLFFLTIKPGEVPTIQPVPQVIDARTGATPNDPGKPQPPPVEPTKDVELTKKARDWALPLKDPETAQALALVYRMVKDAVVDGTLNVEQGIKALGIATDSVLLSRLRTDHWQPFRDKGSQEITFRRQTPVFDFPVFLVAVAHGLESAADGSVKLDLAARLDIVNQVNNAIDEAAK